MNFGFKYRRLGAFMIDLAIVRMFAQVGINIYLGVIAYLGQGTGMRLSLNGTWALPLLLLLMVTVMMVFIGIYIGYHWICYRLVGNSLSRYFLRLQVVSTDGEPLSVARYLKREFDKALFCLATVGIYPLYSGAQFISFGYTPWHDKRNKTKVIQL